MEDQKDTQPQSLIDQIKEYVELQIKIAKYKAIDGSSEAFATIIVAIILSIVGVLILIFASIALGFYLSEVLHTYWGGFGCLAALYLVIALILYITRQSMKNAIADSIINKIFNK